MRSVWFASVFALASGLGHATGLCTPEEKALFSCEAGTKQLSLCASVDVGSDSGYVQARFGSKNHLDWAHPPQGFPSRDHFFYSSTAYSGGGEERLRFTVQGQQYILYSKAVRTGFGNKGNLPVFSDGAFLRSADGKAIDVCTKPATVAGMSAGVFAREAFDASFERSR